VALGTIGLPELVMPTIAQVMGIGEPGAQPLDRLAEAIGGRSILLALDNFEQVVDAGSQVGELLARAPKLSILVTSRAPLRVYGEHEYPVPPLGLPDLSHLPDLEHFSQYESVSLFTERAMAVRPDFAVTSANAPAVAEICVRLDGLPLAIELAAARVRVLTPSAILDRLGDRLGLLSGGARDLPARQQTLRGAIAWSHDLLNAEERRAFAHLSVFVGGATLDAIESVCFAKAEWRDALDLVTSLVDKSLVRQDSDPDGAPRFRMLGTIREFASEQLDERGEAADLRDRHLGWLCGRVESLADSVLGPDQRERLDVYEREHDNVRAALDWAVGRGRTESALRILAATWRFWQFRGYLTEAREQAERILGLADMEAYPDRLAAGLEAAGGIAYWQADFVAAAAWYGRALAQARAGGDERAIANALYNMSSTYSMIQTDQERSRAESLEALEIYRRLGDEAGAARALWALANSYYFFADFTGGIGIVEEALEIFRRLGDRFHTGWSLFMLGLYNLTIDRARMLAALREAFPYFLETDDRSSYGLLFDAFAAYFYAAGDIPRAMRLAGFAAATERSSGTGLAKMTREYAGFIPENLLDDPGLATAYAEGQRLDLESARRLALEEDGALPASR
jgi:predicted ATPase